MSDEDTVDTDTDEKKKVSSAGWYQLIIFSLCFVSVVGALAIPYERLFYAAILLAIFGVYFKLIEQEES
jgi:hypothetical protein